MAAIELNLDDTTLERARKLAAARNCTVEQFVGKVIEEGLDRTAAADTRQDPLLGLFGDDPELLDKLTQAALKAREEQPLRQVGG